MYFATASTAMQRSEIQKAAALRRSLDNGTLGDVRPFRYTHLGSMAFVGGWKGVVDTSNLGMFPSFGSIFIVLLQKLSDCYNEILHNLSRWSRRQAGERISRLFAVARGLLDQTSVRGEQDPHSHVLVQVVGFRQRRVELLKICTISCNYADLFSCLTLCRDDFL